jgi:hypothetical protein
MDTAFDFFFGFPGQLSYLYTSSMIMGWYSEPVWGPSSKGLSPAALLQLMTKHIISVGPRYVFNCYSCISVVPSSNLDQETDYTD